MIQSVGNRMYIYMRRIKEKKIMLDNRKQVHT